MKIGDEARGNFGGFRFSAVCPMLMSLSRDSPTELPIHITSLTRLEDDLCLFRWFEQEASLVHSRTEVDSLLERKRYHNRTIRIRPLHIHWNSADRAVT